MAIEKRVFVTDSSQYAQEVYEWMSANATDYFDSFELITSSGTPIGFRCRIGDTVALTVYMTGSWSATTSAGVTMSCYGTSNYIQRAYKTSNGILLVGYSGNNYRLFITRSSAGNLAFVWVIRTNSNTYGIVVADYEKSVTWNKVINYTSSFQNVTANAAQLSDLTTLTPVVFSGGTYTEHLFLTSFCEYAGTECILTLNGTKYVYDGCFALEE